MISLTMAGSRHLQGTIITRMKYLLQSGSLKETPVWYDVVQRFPPPSTSMLSLVKGKQEAEVQKISYEIDDIKREFYKKFFRAARDPESLFDNIQSEETKTEFFLKEYKKFLNEHGSHNIAMERTHSSFIAHLDRIRSKIYISGEPSKETIDENVLNVDLDVGDIYDMFNDTKKK